MLLGSLLIATAASRGQLPSAGIPNAQGDVANMTAAMRADCPRSYEAFDLIRPKLCKPGSQVPCGQPCGGGCPVGKMCDLDGMIAPGEAGRCVDCPPGRCCVTIPGELLAKGLENIAGIGGATQLPIVHELSGAVLLNVRPCPRNFMCASGKMDDFRNASNRSVGGSNCYADRCRTLEGCPEGTTVPESRSNKLLALGFAALWLVCLKLVRKSYAMVRAKRWTRRAGSLSSTAAISNARLRGDPHEYEPLEIELTRNSIATSTLQGATPKLTFRQGVRVTLNMMRACQQETQLRRTIGPGFGEIRSSASDSDDDDSSPDPSALSVMRATFCAGRVAGTSSAPSEMDRVPASLSAPSEMERKAAALALLGGAIQGLDIQFNNLTLALADGRKVLKGVTGKLHAGRLCAIMGPSGAGKTTFLYTLCGKASYGTQGGKLTINGQKASVSDCRNAFGFVPQEDTMLRMMTVNETVDFNAAMRLPPTFSSHQRGQIVATVLDILGLTAVRDQKIGDEETRGISGGQRKRVNVAMELCAKPTMLFLDEPTSGLDATASLTLIQALRATAEQGITVAAVLHQPRWEMFCLFHDVLLLGPGGTTVYLGPSTAAKSYFEGLGYIFPREVNPADYLLDIIGGAALCEGDPTLTPAQLPARWEKERLRIESTFGNSSSDTMGGLLAARARKGASFVKQVSRFAQRQFIQQYRPISMVLTDYGLIFLAGAVLGCSQRNTELKQLPLAGALSSLAIGLTTIVSSTRCFGDERVVFWREAAAGLNRHAYFFGKNIGELPRLFFVPAFYLLIFSSTTGLSNHPTQQYVLLLAAVWAISGLGYFVSLVVSPKNAQLAGVLVVLLSLMSNGIFVPKHKLGWLNTKFHMLDFSFGYHMAYASYILDEDGFADFWAPDPNTFDFGVVNIIACPFDQACLKWAWMKTLIREQYGFSGVAGELHHKPLLGLFFIGIAARISALCALLFTAKDKQV